ncbi:transposase [Tenuifilum thalassicum]|uniref:Transposase IS200-like domain-containing protein n=1 Tax=Tenuifilum thalassicum TaxID=2590900 RepID=A0A7D4BL06_9BACT|nr:transposase [Tenuifilum thalassicum]QKG80619.1 hypothetical protein FHG85_10170 [Tenuifilum thalassicum]
MNKYKPNIHHRHSIRLRGYDYSQAGAYFITICTQNRTCLFGNVVDGNMVLNDAGMVAQNCWLEIPKHFPNTTLDEFVIMPNHIHGIIVINIVGANNHSPLQCSPQQQQNHSPLHLPQQTSELFQSPSRSIGSIVRGFKIGVTKWFRQDTDVYHVWQRNYYEHIVRNDDELNAIRQYIINNPLKWRDDENFMK